MFHNEYLQQDAKVETKLMMWWYYDYNTENVELIKAWTQ